MDDLRRGAGADVGSIFIFAEALNHESVCFRAWQRGRSAIVSFIAGLDTEVAGKAARWDFIRR